MKITIKNETRWPTSMLRPFIVRAAREEFDDSTPKRTSKRTLRVEIAYAEAQHGGCSGVAYVHANWSRIRVPHPDRMPLQRPDSAEAGEWSRTRARRANEPRRAFPVHDFVHVLIHEFGHNAGLKHPMMGGRYQNRSKPFIETTFPWVTTLPRPVIRDKVKPTTAEKRETKLLAAKDAVVRWERKVKLATTKLKHWRQRARAIERTLVKAAEQREVTHGSGLHEAGPAGDGGEVRQP